MQLKPKTEKTIRDISASWAWDNYTDTRGKYWTILQALYCKLSWVEEETNNEEHKDIITDTLRIIEALQKEIKI